MQPAATLPVNASDAPTPAARGWRALLRPALPLAILWFFLCRHLANEWSANEQYSYGWFVPFFAAYLFWLRWESRPAGANQKSEVSNQPSGFLLSTFYFLLLAALLPIRLFEVGNPDWRPLSWVHALTVVGLSLLVLRYWRGWPAVRHFAFPVCFILVAVPWITPIEGPITQGLMRIVAAIASETVNLLGVPAQLEGNVIRISSGVVGVNEACSGVRSLQTSLMIGLLFGELKRLSLVSRLLLIGGAVGIAFVANCGRAFFLVWMAVKHGVAGVSQWHDLAGYAIVVAVFVGTMALAGALGRGTEGESLKEKVKSSSPARAWLLSDFRLPTSAFVLAFGWLVAVEAGVEGWYRWHESRLVSAERWSVEWPASAPGLRQLPIADETKQILRFDEGRQVAWTIPPGDGPPANAMLFFFRWQPGTGNILRARSHRPDICLPAVGWKETSDYGVRSYAAGEQLSLPFRHFAFALDDPRRQGVVAHAFFCLREDKVPPGAKSFDVGRASATEWDRNDRVRIVLEGLRNPGQQMLELILIGPPELTPAAAEARLAEMLPELVRVEPAAR